jgi:hypothetical protein
MRGYNLKGYDIIDIGYGYLIYIEVVLIRGGVL